MFTVLLDQLDNHHDCSFTRVLHLICCPLSRSILPCFWIRTCSCLCSTSIALSMDCSPDFQWFQAISGKTHSSTCVQTLYPEIIQDVTSHSFIFGCWLEEKPAHWISTSNSILSSNCLTRSVFFQLLFSLRKPSSLQPEHMCDVREELKLIQTLEAGHFKTESLLKPPRNPFQITSGTTRRRNICNYFHANKTEEDIVPRKLFPDKIS